ncbi:class I SAM-dependent methyltransferase [Flavobacterium sp.]|uniref:class I SAM-dependent methyltransferase n=1 Tax=Flavobacterium sp. TaxID=239 RepID=UPI0037BFF819
MKDEANFYKRTADEKIYLENRFEKPKETMKQIVSLLNLDAEHICSEEFTLLDIGTATGEFLYHIRKSNPKIILDGIEFSDKLVDHSKDFLSKFNIALEQGDANNLEFIPDNKYNFVTSLGVTSIFEDFRPAYSEMIRVAKDRGICINSMIVNEGDVDVKIQYKTQTSKGYESGWNKFSIKSIGDFLSQHDRVEKFEFIKHTMPFDLPKQSDIMRSWTTYDINGNRILWNGLNMEITLYHVVFYLK